MRDPLPKSKMRNYQLRMAAFAEQRRAGNVFAGMGTGKTVAKLTAADTLLTFGEVYKPLVLAPLRVAKHTWPSEAHGWEHLSHLRIVPIVGSAKQRRAALARSGDIWTINYENLDWLRDELGADSKVRGRWDFDLVIADESTKLKSFDAKRVRAMRKVRKFITRWYNLTGTPTPRGLIDLWQQQWFVDSGQRLGKSLGAYRQRWFDQPAYSHDWVPKPGAEEAIHDAIRDCTISIQASDFLELPPLVYNDLVVPMPDKLEREYRRLERDMVIELASAGQVTAASAAAMSMKCRQFANGAIYYDTERSWEEVHTLKLDALEDIVEEMSGEPLLVAYYFKSDLERIRRRFPYAQVLTSDPEVIEAWNRREIPLLLAHPESAGHGLSLQHGGHNLAIFAPSWSLEAMQQILERLGPVRQAQSGYNRPVFVHRILIDGTIEQAMYDRLETRASVQEALMRAVRMVA